MKFLADRETRRQLLTLLVLAAAGGWLGFSLSWQAGCLVLALCCLFSLMTLRCTWRRYRSTEALCADLDRLLEGAVDETTQQIGAFFQAIREDAPVPAWFDRDFKGNPPEGEKAWAAALGGSLS